MGRVTVMLLALEHTFGSVTGGENAVTEPAV
jgi:hypothetical protein